MDKQNKQNLYELDEEIEREGGKRNKKRKKMKVSGAGIKELQRIIRRGTKHGEGSG